jgi:hypothetical protein
VRSRYETYVAAFPSRDLDGRRTRGQQTTPFTVDRHFGDIIEFEVRFALSFVVVVAVVV